MADWQHIAALALAGMAVIYLLRSLWGRSAREGSGACGGCQKCEGLEGQDTCSAFPVVDVNTLVSTEEQHVLGRRQED